MSVTTKLSIHTIGQVIKNIFSPRNNVPTPLGRWKLCENKNINLVIDYSNEDHCGTCSRHTIVQYHNPDTKIYETNKSNDNKSNDNKSNDNKSNDNELFSYDYQCLLSNNQEKV